jgi:hypothetical protein
MVTVCKYYKGLHSTVGYCAFLAFLFMANLGSIPASDIFFYFKRKICILLKTLQIAMKFERYILSLSTFFLCPFFSKKGPSSLGVAINKCQYDGVVVSSSSGFNH